MESKSTRIYFKFEIQMKIKCLFLGLVLSSSLYAADKYSNPVIDYSLPDPSIIKGDDGYFYLYATEISVIYRFTVPGIW